METRIIDSPNEIPKPDREFLLNQLKEIEFRTEDLNRERDETLKEIIAPDEQMKVEHPRKAMTAEAIRDQILVFFFNIHNNLPEHKKDEPATIKHLLKEIESRIQALSKMLQLLRIEEELEGLKREQDKVKSDLAKLEQAEKESRQVKFGFRKK